MKDNLCKLFSTCRNCQFIANQNKKKKATGVRQVLNPYIQPISCTKKKEVKNHPQWPSVYKGTNNNPNILNIESMTDTFYSILKYSKTIFFYEK